MALVREAILTLPYFGSIDHYAQLLHRDAWVDIYENYVKQSARNRMDLCGSQGIFSLSVPVKKAHGDRPTLKDIRISHDAPWQNNHWKAIRSAYGASPFFFHYAEELQAFFNEEYDTLVELNNAAHQMVCSLLSHEIPLRFSEQYISSTFGEDLRSIYRNQFIPCPTYIQVFSDRNPFFPGLSILDLIFCLGPEAESYLLTYPMDR